MLTANYGIERVKELLDNLKQNDTNLSCMYPALSNEVVWDAFGCPCQFGQTWVDLFVEKADSFFEQSSLLLR